MRKMIIYTLFALLAKQTIGCASGDWYEEMEYYSIFNQCNFLSDKSLSEYLYVGDAMYYYGCENGGSSWYETSENIEDWHMFFGEKYSLNEVNDCIFKTVLTDIALLKRRKIDGVSKNVSSNKLVMDLAKGKHTEFLAYLEYAKQCEQYTGHRYYRWGGQQDESDMRLEMVTRGKKLYRETRSEVLRVRYAYQMIRLAHYAREFEYALEIYNAYAQNIDVAGQFKYYILDQMGGVYRGLGRYEDAIGNYIKVYTNSRDRKGGVTQSLQMTRMGDWENIERWNEIESGFTNEEKLYYHLINAHGGYSLGELKEAFKVDPSHPVCEVLFARVVKENETAILPRYYDTLFSNGGDISELLKFYYDNYQKFPDNSFYKACVGYAHFLNQEPQKAEKLFHELALANKGESIADTFNALAQLAHLTAFPEFDKDAELWYLQNQISGVASELAQRVVAHRYLVQKEYAKSFLVHYDLDFFYERFDLDLLEKLEVFYHKANKNEWEKELASRVDAADFERIRGLYYLRAGKLTEANKAFSKSDLDISIWPEDSAFVTYINDWKATKHQAANHGMACYEGMITVPELNGLAELTNYLLKLEEQAEKGKYAAECYEMIGSFYYNIMGYGTKRELVNMFPDYNMEGLAVEEVEIIPGYDYHDYDVKNTRTYETGYWRYYDDRYTFNNPMISYHYMQKAFKATKSGDDEGKARRLFALAKCQEVLAYQEEELVIDGVAQPYGKYFDQLIDSYDHTEYYKLALRSCATLNYYQTSSEH